MCPEKKPTANLNEQLLKVMMVVFLQVAGIVLLIVLPAILAGLWLDKMFNTTPFLTLFLVVASIPLTVFALVYLLKKTVGKLTSDQAKPSATMKEEASFGTENED